MKRFTVSLIVLHAQLEQVDLMGITIKSLAEIEKEVSRHGCQVGVVPLIFEPLCSPHL